MKVRLSQVIGLANFKDGHISISKEFESNIIPHKGDYIADLVWDEPYQYKVSEVVIDYSQNTCYVTLAMIVLESSDLQALKKFKEIAELHNWEVIGYVG